MQIRAVVLSLSLYRSILSGSWIENTYFRIALLHELKCEPSVATLDVGLLGSWTTAPDENVVAGSEAREVVKAFWLLDLTSLQ